MTKHYTDADVQRAVDAIDKHCEWSKDWASDTALCIATDVLPAVAPAITARALREAARDLPGFDGIRTHGDAARWLRDRADEIERGAL